jgi:hypothetical protein
MNNKVNIQTLTAILSNPNIRVFEVYGPKPNTIEYERAVKANINAWEVIFNE